MADPIRYVIGPDGELVDAEQARQAFDELDRTMRVAAATWADALRAALQDIADWLASPEVQEAFAALGYSPRRGNPRGLVHPSSRVGRMRRR